MKRLVLALAAIAAAAGPMAAATTANAQTRTYQRDYDRGDRSGSYDRGDRTGGYDRGDRSGGYDRNGGYDRRDNDRRDYDRRDSYRGGSSRWDSRQHNGYYLGNRWYYGTPSSSYYSRRDYRPAYRAWSRGSYLPRNYWGYRVNDYSRYRLRQPPRGYGWVRVNNDYVLMALATGLILDVIVGNSYY